MTDIGDNYDDPDLVMEKKTCIFYGYKNSFILSFEVAN